MVLRHGGLEGFVLQVGPVHPVRNLHQPDRIDDAGNLVELVAGQAELVEQEVDHRRGAVVGDFEADFVAEVALLQFSLQRRAQILDLFLVDEEVAVAGHAELVAAQYGHAGEQLADVRVQDRREEHEAVIDSGQLVGEADHAWQNARRLDDRRVRNAAESIATLQFDREVQTLVEHAREGMGGVQADRRQNRHQLAEEEVAYPGPLFGRPDVAAQELDAFSGECWQHRIVEQRVLLGDQGMDFATDPPVELDRREFVRVGGLAAQFDLFAHPGDPHFEELVEVAGDDAEVFEALEQRDVAVRRLRQNAALEGEKRELAIDVVLGGVLALPGASAHCGQSPRSGKPLFCDISAAMT